MFTFSNAIKNIRRHLRKSVMYLLICIIAALTLQIYMAGIDRTEAQLLQLPDAIPISVRVGNIDGSRFAGIQVHERTVDGLINSHHARNLLMTVSLFTGGRDFTLEGHARQQDTWKAGVVGVNTLEVLEGFSADTVEWLPGYGPDSLEGDEAVCIVDRIVMEWYGWSLGDSIMLNLLYYRYEAIGTLFFDPLELMEVRIIGVANVMAANASSFIIPFETARAAFHRQGIEFRASSASFYVSDGLLLNDFKAEMKTLPISRPITDGSAAMAAAANQATALFVNDASFISAAARLQETLALFRAFLPLMAAALAAIGYFVAYLMIQNRREEYAVLRLLGMSKRGSMALYFCEIAILTLGGSFLGVLISTAVGIGGINSGIRVFVLLALCFMLGSLIALWRLGRTNVMLALSKQD